MNAIKYLIRRISIHNSLKAVSILIGKVNKNVIDTWFARWNTYTQHPILYLHARTPNGIINADKYLTRLVSANRLLILGILSLIFWLRWCKTLLVEVQSDPLNKRFSICCSCST